MNKLISIILMVLTGCSISEEMAKDREEQERLSHLTLHRVEVLCKSSTVECEKSMKELCPKGWEGHYFDPQMAGGDWNHAGAIVGWVMVAKCVE